MGIYLDPPYDQGDQRVYGDPALNSSVWPSVVEWCVANCVHLNLRIVLSGYSGAYGQDDMERAGMRRVDLVAPRGFARNGNRAWEACWLSPRCIFEAATQATLF